jgi:hypothetical protein
MSLVSGKWSGQRWRSHSVLFSVANKLDWGSSAEEAELEAIKQVCDLGLMACSL